MKRDAIVSFLDSYLDPDTIADSSCNGLQIEGAAVVEKIGLAVDASMDAYRAAVAAGCQMLIVHHGLIWNGLRSVSGAHGRQVRYCIEHDLNLYASHLPLDRHAVCGNNMQLARMLRCKNITSAFSYKGVNIGYRGTMDKPLTCAQIAACLHRELGGESVILPFGKNKNTSVGIVSGGAADSLAEAIALGVDCYVTGEPAHFNHHQAKEAGINVVYGGHYHTEKPGVLALGRELEKKYKVKTVFLDVPTLV